MLGFIELACSVVNGNPTIGLKLCQICNETMMEGRSVPFWLASVAISQTSSEAGTLERFASGEEDGWESAHPGANPEANHHD